MRNAADPDQVNGAGRKVQIRQERAVNDVREVMSTASGRRVLRSIVVELCGIYRTGEEPSRDTGLRIRADLCAVCPKEWELAEREHRELAQREGVEE